MGLALASWAASAVGLRNQVVPANEPIDHHYLPVFYLSEWAGTDRHVCRISRPYGTELRAKRVSPRGTAFEERLYGNIETSFMSRLDSEAAKALKLLKQGLSEQDWTSRPQSAWSRFLLTQLLRAPEDIDQLRSNVSAEWEKVVPELQQRDPDRHAGAIDVGDLQVRDLGDAQAAAIGGTEPGAVLQARRVRQQQRDLLGAQHDRQPLGRRNPRHAVAEARPAQRRGEEEPQRRAGLVHASIAGTERGEVASEITGGSRLG